MLDCELALIMFFVILQAPMDR